MKRQFAIFIAAFVLIALLGLSLIPRTLADLAVLYPNPAEVSGTVVMLKPQVPNPAPEMLVEMQQVIAHRLNQLNLADRYEVSIKDGQVLIVLPAGETTSEVVNAISQVGQIEFIDGGVAAPLIGKQIMTHLETSQVGNRAYPVLFTGGQILTASPPDSKSGDIFYRITLESAAAEQLEAFAALPDHYLCLVFDKKVANCSTMFHWSHNTLEFLPDLGSSQNVNKFTDLVIFLNSGPLPVPVEVVSP